MASGCRKDSYYGSGNSTEDYRADCRQNSGYGDLFSWQAVSDYQAQLCPEGWRVPTKDEFVALDVALGGTGSNRTDDAATRNKYLSLWGGSYGGYCLSDGTLESQGVLAIYGSQSVYNATDGFCLYFLTIDFVYPQGYDFKDYGFSLRCVR
jgi:uncharacterized protein (TIGR02145 family)